MQDKLNEAKPEAGKESPRIQAAVTISLVPQAKGGPFVFWDGLEASCRSAAQLGFHAVEVFPPSAQELNAKQLKQALRDHSLQLAALGTGAGWVLQKLTLTDPDPAVRRRAQQFIEAIIDLASSFGAPAIIGSMQGRAAQPDQRDEALARLQEALDQLGPRAHAAGVPLLFEPLNRYETNLINTVAQALDLLRPLRTQNVRLLCDLFHMNIEEASIPEALRSAGPQAGHIHWADSNRRAAGFGHTDLDAIARALVSLNYRGFVSAEVFPLPDPAAAARQTIESYRKHFTHAP